MGILDKYIAEYKRDQTDEKGKLVTKVACVREDKDLHFTTFSNNEKKLNTSLTRTSNKCNNLEPVNCDSCPAGGHWDYPGPGMYCFHRAYFLGKSGKPVPCSIAKDDCPLHH